MVPYEQEYEALMREQAVAAHRASLIAMSQEAEAGQPHIKEWHADNADFTQIHAAKHF